MEIINSEVCCHFSCVSCNIKGCITCGTISYRYLNTIDANNITCSCLPTFVESYLASCKCPHFTFYMNNECKACPLSCG